MIFCILVTIVTLKITIYFSTIPVNTHSLCKENEYNIIYIPFELMTQTYSSNTYVRVHTRSRIIYETFYNFG